MRTDKITWGIILVSLGSILLLDNLGVINFYWGNMWHYWPVLLILAGIKMVFARNNSAYGNTIAVVTTCVVLGFLVFAGLTYRGNENRWYFNGDRVNRKHREKSEYNFIEAFTPGTRRAELNISGGATSYKIEETTSELIDARVKQVEGLYSLKKTSRDSVEVLAFSMRENHGNWDMDGDNEVKLKLNPEPVWDINVKIGAGETNFDLTPFKVQTLTFGGGAASFKARLGEPESITNVSVKSGVSDINIDVPETVGCKIQVKTGLSSEDFDGFTRQADGTYVTSNFSSAPKKIIINLNGGLSNFEVNRY